MIQRYQTLRILWMTGFFWICVAWHGDAKPTDHSGELVLLLKKLNHKLEDLTNKMSRLEGRLGFLEQKIDNIRADAEKKNKEFKDALKVVSDGVKAQGTQISQEATERAKEQKHRMDALFLQSLSKTEGVAKTLTRVERTVGDIKEQTETLQQGRAYPIAGLPSAKRVWIPAGEFMMGSPGGEPNRDSDEGPQRRVRISQGYWMMKTEVTQGQWKALMGDNPSHFKNCGEDCPVEQVRWHEAALFANKLSEREGRESCFVCSGSGKSVQCEGKGNKSSDYVDCRGWRLPTEAEWEYAARGGTTTAFSTGKCLSTDQANYDGNYPQSGCAKGVYREKTVKVCTFAEAAKHPWGLCDVHGNVWEWVYDWYHADAYQQLSGDVPSVDPVFVETGSSRSIRGGGWYNDARGTRSANRFRSTPTRGGYVLGLRLLRR